MEVFRSSPVTLDNRKKHPACKITHCINNIIKGLCNSFVCNYYKYQKRGSLCIRV